ncbi:MAG: hypothetical protein ACLQU1_34080 [Bryobacteraceae bacterium]
MNWKLALGNVFRLFLRLTAALVVQGLLRQAGFYEFTARDSAGLSLMIGPVGEIYAVLLAFTIFVIWGQFTEVENLVIRECNSLDDLLRFAAYLSADASAAIRRSIADYARRVLKYEWPALGEGRTDKQADELFVEILSSVVDANPSTEAQKLIHVRLLEMAQRTGTYRDERVAKSLTRMPPTLSGLVRSIAAVLLLLIFVYPFLYEITGAVCFVLVSVVVFLANLVMTDTDNPIQGIWNVSPKPFAGLASQ